MTSPDLSQRLGTLAPTLALLFLSAIAATACGGTQRGGGLQQFHDDVAVQNILEILPAEVSFAYIADFDEDGAARMRVQWRNSTLGPVFASMIEEQTGHNLTDPEGLAEIGVDLLGEFGIYSTTALPVGIARLSEPTKFEAFVSDYRARNPDRVWSSFTIAEAEFWSTAIQESDEVDLFIDVGIVGNYAVVRLRSSLEGSFVDDESLTALIEGSNPASLADDARLVDLQQQADGPITAVGIIDTYLFRKALGFFGSLGSRAGSPACDTASDAIAVAMPWHAGVHYRSGDVRRGVHVTQLSETAANHARGIVGGTSIEALDAASESPLFVALNVNLDAALELMNGDPRLVSECADLGAISGLFATMRQQMTEQTRDTIRKLTGLVMFSLEGFTVTGFIPRLDAGIAVGSSNPVPLTESVQAMLDSSGAIGRVDDTAPFTTFEYSLLGYEIRVSQLIDRVVVATAGVPIALFNAMAVSEDRNGQFVEVRMHGPPIAAMMREAQRYFLGNAAAETQVQFESMASSYDTIEWMTYGIGLEGNTLVGTFAAEMSPLEAE